MNKFISFIIMSLIGINMYSQNKNFIDQPYIETSATVDTMVIPDRIYLRIVITEKDTKGKISTEEMESKMEATLKSLNIDTEKKLSLYDLASDFERYFLKKQDIMKSKAYTLLLEDAITAGKVIITLEKIEISNVYVVKVEYSKIELLKLDLLAKAVRKAKKQAEVMAQQLNQKVGGAIYISDESDIFSNETLEMPATRYAYKSIPIEYKPANINFDKITVYSQVNVKFKIE